MKVIFGKLGHDKGMHLGAGLFIFACSLGAVAIANQYGAGIPMRVACVPGAVAGIAKEVYDLKKTGTAEILDFLATLAPSFVAYFFLG